MRIRIGSGRSVSLSCLLVMVIVCRVFHTAGIVFFMGLALFSLFSRSLLASSALTCEKKNVFEIFFLFSVEFDGIDWLGFDLPPYTVQISVSP